MVPHPPLHPAGSVESIAHALSRLTQRQNERKYTARRPVVSALKATSQPSPVSTQPPIQKNSSKGDENAPAGGEVNCIAIAANSNSSNSRDYVTPVPSYVFATEMYQPPPTVVGSRWGDFSQCRSDLQSQNTFQPSGDVTSDEQSTLLVSPFSQVTPNSGNTMSCTSSDHNNMHLSPHIQSFQDHHPSLFSSSAQEASGGDRNCSSKHRYGTRASLDLLKRIQMHNKAISHYTDMQRLHHSPSVPASSPVCPSRREPVPSSSSSHSHTAISAPSFNFIVPHPPSTPKPNFILRGHRGVVGTSWCVIHYSVMSPILWIFQWKQGTYYSANCGCYISLVSSLLLCGC